MQSNDRALFRFGLDIESIKYNVCQLLDNRKEELQALVNDELQKAQTTLEVTVREGVRTAVKDAIKKVFVIQSYALTEALEPFVQKELLKIVTTLIKESE